MDELQQILHQEIILLVQIAYLFKQGVDLSVHFLVDLFEGETSQNYFSLAVEILCNNFLLLLNFSLQFSHPLSIHLPLLLDLSAKILKISKVELVLLPQQFLKKSDHRPHNLLKDQTFLPRFYVSEPDELSDGTHVYGVD